MLILLLVYLEVCEMLFLLMYVRFCLNIDPVTCSLGSLINQDFAYVRTVLAEYRLYCLFIVEV